jgi:hypothetical protein
LCASLQNQQPKDKSMKIQVDPKSALCGLAIGVLAMLAMGADDAAPAIPPARYQVSTGSGISVIVDNQTGQAWMFNAGGPAHTDGNFFAEKK